MTLPDREELEALDQARTPGEWRVNENAYAGVETCERRSTASCGGFQDGTQESHLENIANARLCALAPDLLRGYLDAMAENKRLRKFMNSQAYLCRRLRAALELRDGD